MTKLSRLENAEFAIIQTVWWQRYPVRAEDLWPMLEAHGFPKSHLLRFVDRFNFGIDLLVHAQGRRPNSRRRMEPLSKGRYLTAAQVALRSRIFGGNFGNDPTPFKKEN
ncbi:hypothetical protein ACJ4V0_11855 [Phreatobacter sp. HK31-P]